jgi:hypothetical protein
VNAKKDRAAVYAKTGAVAAVYVALLWSVYQYSAIRWPAYSWFWVAATFVGVQCALTSTILIGVYIHRSVVEIRRRRGLSALYFLRQCIASHAAGDDLRAELAPTVKSFPSEFDATLLEFLDGFRGTERERLVDLAASMGTVDRNIRAYRSRNPAKRRNALDALAKIASPEARLTLERALDDPDESLRLTASRALLSVGGRAEAEKVFATSLLQAPVFRALVAEDLRPFILVLKEKAVPEALRSNNLREVLATLDIIWSWGRVIDLPEATAFVDSPDSVIRAVAIHACRYAAPHTLSSMVPRCLEDPAPIVRRAAAEAAERLVLAAALPQLLQCLSDSDERVARSAAKAMSRMGAKGLNLLEVQVIEGSPHVAPVALEAVEKARLGRIDWE